MNQERSGSQDSESPRFALVSDKHVLWPWLIQLFGVAFIPVAFEIFEGSVLGWSEVAGSPFGVIGIQVFNPAVIIALAFAVGFVASTKLPPKGAKWIWTVPCAMLLLAIIGDLRIFHNWHGIWADYFYLDNPGADEGPLLRDLLTYPALSAVVYSAAAVFVSRTRGLGRAPADQPATH